MEVLLKEEVLKLGRRGDVVKVSRGYAVNYLIPRGLGTFVSQANVRNLEHEEKKYLEREGKRKVEFGVLAKQLAEHSVTIEANANEDGHLFGSVNYEMIREAFAADGFDLDVRIISLEKAEQMPIKEVGIYNLRIALHADVIASSKCWVVEATDGRKDDDDEDDEDADKAKDSEPSEES